MIKYNFQIKKQKINSVLHTYLRSLNFKDVDRTDYSLNQMFSSIKDQLTLKVNIQKFFFLNFCPLYPLLKVQFWRVKRCPASSKYLIMFGIFMIFFERLSNPRIFSQNKIHNTINNFHFSICKVTGKIICWE